MKFTVNDKKMTLKEQMGFYIKNHMTPLIIKCHSNYEWHILFDEQPVIIDALKITNSELTGINYRERSKFTPLWFQELLEKRNQTPAQAGGGDPGAGGILRCPDQ